MNFWYFAERVEFELILLNNKFGPQLSSLVDADGGPAARGRCKRSGAMDLWGCNRSGACNTFWAALLEFRVQHTSCSTMPCTSLA
eukprot:4170213-Pyramimonas_sp.AAC.1